MNTLTSVVSISFFVLNEHALQGLKLIPPLFLPRHWSYSCDKMNQDVPSVYLASAEWSTFNLKTLILYSVHFTVAHIDHILLPDSTDVVDSPYYFKLVVDMLNLRKYALFHTAWNSGPNPSSIDKYYWVFSTTQHFHFHNSNWLCNIQIWSKIAPSQAVSQSRFWMLTKREGVGVFNPWVTLMS